jgi:BioD-like phosphotransacetylase family protein
LGVLFIVSAEEAAGKTAICAGLAVNFSNEGRKVGYLKPPAAGKDGSDSDVAFMKQTLGLNEAINTPDLVKGRDIVLVEGYLGPDASDAASRSTYGAAREMKARVIAVEAYSGRASRFIDVYKGFGADLLGVVINKVPESRLKSELDAAGARFQTEGIKVLGVIPENRTLLAITVGELAEGIGGKILNQSEKAAELVENFLLGAMIVDSGLEYFGRKDHKAVIIRQDRPDMQLAALETATSCLVLSGSENPPLYNVMYKAENRGIPVIATGAGVNDIVAKIEATLPKTRLNQAGKLKKLAEVVGRNLDTKALA